MQCLLRNNKTTNILIALLLLTSLVYSQSTDTIAQVKSDKAGYSSDIEKGILSLTAFMALDDDAEPHTFLRFPKLDSLTKPWFACKRKVNDNIGLQISPSYSSTTQYGRNAPDNKSELASSGIFKIYSRFTLVNQHKENNGTLVLNLDHRHKYTDITPSKLGFDLGYNGMPALLFSDTKLILLELTWQQKFNKGRTGIVIGRYDPNDYFDVLGYVNPFTTFQNLSILVNPSIALPDSSTGIGIGHWINDQFALQITVNDVNGVATELQFFEDFGELYTSGEFSWSPSRKERFFKNFHVTAWHSDERTKVGIEESHGIAIGGNWTFHETFMPFFKAGWSTGGTPIYSDYFCGGFIIRPNINKDLIGLGVSWGKTQADIGQLSSELFYRFQMSQILAFTSSVQYIQNPGLNTNLDNMFVFGLRGRVAL